MAIEISKRQKILEALAARPPVIQPHNGYQTDAGDRLHLGRTRLGPDDVLPAIAMTVGRSETIAQGRAAQISMLVRFHALVSAGLADPLTAIEALISDLKRAVFLDIDPTLGGLLAEPGLQMGEVEPDDREEGSLTVGAHVEAIATYVEKYGHPEA